MIDLKKHPNWGAYKVIIKWVPSLTDKQHQKTLYMYSELDIFLWWHIYADWQAHHINRGIKMWRVNNSKDKYTDGMIDYLEHLMAHYPEAKISINVVPRVIYGRGAKQYLFDGFGVGIVTAVNLTHALAWAIYRGAPSWMVWVYFGHVTDERAYILRPKNEFDPPQQCGYVKKIGAYDIC